MRASMRAVRLADTRVTRRTYGTALAFARRAGTSRRSFQIPPGCRPNAVSSLLFEETRRKKALSQKCEGARDYSASTAVPSPSLAVGARNGGVEEPALVPSDAQRQTIYAVATPPGKGGVAVIRVSGPDALQVYHRMVRTSNTRPQSTQSTSGKGKQPERISPEPRKLVRCRVVEPETEEDLDDGMAVFFRGPHSFSTEDVLELHVHSGRAILSSILGALSRLSQSMTTSHALLLRPAERGEFTLRAFKGGRLDLTQAEALRDLIDADTETQRRVALCAARGDTRERFEVIRNGIIKAMAMTEALIDFGEGEDLEEGVYDHARELIQQLQRTITGHLADSRRGEILRSGLRLAIFGPPNAGKSSLLNYFAGREAAIVTPIPGTTRDVLELTLDIGGLPVVVADTAGLRKSDDVVEQIGVERARERVATADAALCVLSLADAEPMGSEGFITDNVHKLISPSTFILLNKTDLSDDARVQRARLALGDCAGAWAVSLSTGRGLETFVDEFSSMLHQRYVDAGGREQPLVTNARHRAHLQAAREYLDAALATDDIVIAAEELRYAANSVGKVTGAIDVEEVLDVIFREFCIGK